VSQHQAGSPQEQLRVNGEGFDAPLPLGSLGSELQDSEPQSKALQAFLRFQGRLGAGGASRGRLIDSSAEPPAASAEGQQGHSVLGSNPEQGIQHAGQQAGVPWAPPMQPLPNGGHVWAHQQQQQQPVGPFGGWQPARAPLGPTFWCAWGSP